MAGSGDERGDYLELALKLAREAGDLILAAFNDKDKRITSKSSAVDVVTETDKACEALIIRGVRERYPDHRFIAEESFVDEGRGYDFTDAPTWIIDPVDGTTNFVHSFPFTCVCVGVAVGREVVVGVVHNPVMRQTYTAVRGRGAFLNGEPIRPSPVTEWGSALLCMEFGYERRPEGVDRNLAKIRALLVDGGVQGIRSLGSCALNMCGVASGSLDAYYEGVDLEQGPKPWDIAAASLVVTEAGGVVRDVNGDALDMCSGRILCANNAGMADTLVAKLKSA